MSIGESLAAASNRFYLRIRDRRAWKVAEGPAETIGFDALRGHKYCLLITYKRDGTPIPTPVWFGLGEDGRVYTRSEPAVGKVKRIRGNGRARLAPCTMRGRPKGPAADGRARVLPPEEEERAEATLAANYGLGRKLYEGGLGGVFPIETLYIEISPEGGGA